MQSLILEQLDNLGLLKGERVNAAALSRLSKRKLLDVLTESVELTSARDLSREQSIFSHSATLSLSGGPHPCFLLDHRLQTAQNLSQYAALYSDKVFIYNFLAEHVAHRENHVEEDELKGDVYSDLTVIAYLRPLIESGRIVPITPPEEFCPRCFEAGTKSSEQKRKATRRWLRDRYLNEIEVKLEQTGDRFGFILEGSDLLLEHGTAAWLRKTLPKGFKKVVPNLAARLRRGERITLSKGAKRVAKVHQMSADEVLRNVFFELLCAHCLGSSFLTERPLDIDIRNRLSNDNTLAKRNSLVQEHLTALVPFLSSVRIKDLIALRESERDSFLAFRQAFTRAIDDYCAAQNDRFNANDASQLYGDVIEPELAKISLALTTARRKHLKSSGIGVLSWVGAIGFGLYSGFVPKELEEAARVLGLTKILAELGTKMFGMPQARDELASNNMYFLWRVQKMAASVGRRR